MTYICISRLTVTGSDNGLSRGRRQLSRYLNQWWNIVNWTLRNKLQWKFNRNSNIFIHENAIESVVCEMAAILSWPQWVNVIGWAHTQNDPWCCTYLSITSSWCHKRQCRRVFTHLMDAIFVTFQWPQKWLSEHSLELGCIQSSSILTGCLERMKGWIIVSGNCKKWLFAIIIATTVECLSYESVAETPNTDVFRSCLNPRPALTSHCTCLVCEKYECLTAKIDVYCSLLPSDHVIGWDIKITSHPNSNASFLNIWDRIIWWQLPNLTRSSISPARSSYL